MVDSSAVVSILLSSAPWHLCSKDLFICSSPYNFIRFFLGPVRATGNSLFQPKRPKNVLGWEVSGGKCLQVSENGTSYPPDSAVCHLHVQLSKGLPVRGAHLTLAEGTHCPQKGYFPNHHLELRLNLESFQKDMRKIKFGMTQTKTSANSPHFTFAELCFFEFRPREC